ncbi:hypothetical protein Psyaliredsea_29730 [Psychrobacter alimentarius]
MRRMYLRPAIFGSSRRTAIGVMLVATVISTGCTTNYLTNSTEGTYGVPMTERTIPQRLLDRSIEHTVKINVYGLKEDLQQTSRMGIDSFNSEVLLTGEVPTQAIKEEVEKSSAPCQMYAVFIMSWTLVPQKVTAQRSTMVILPQS